MIKHHSRLSVQRIPISALHVAECQPRYPERLQHYIALMQQYPDDSPGLLSVQPSLLHPGMYEVLDGHHRFCAHIMTGRNEVLCLVVEEPGEASNEANILDTLSQEQNKAVQHLIEKADAYGIERLNALYTERNQCVALIARMAQALGYNAGKVVGPSALCDASEEWNLVFIDLPSGQVSWHIHESEMPFFAFLPLYEKRYDGHDATEKYRRALAPLSTP